jgi:hypothetical protein
MLTRIRFVNEKERKQTIGIIVMMKEEKSVGIDFGVG